MYRFSYLYYIRWHDCIDFHIFITFISLQDAVLVYKSVDQPASLLIMLMLMLYISSCKHTWIRHLRALTLRTAVQVVKGVWDYIKNNELQVRAHTCMLLHARIFLRALIDCFIQAFLTSQCKDTKTRHGSILTHPGKTCPQPHA